MRRILFFVSLIFASTGFGQDDRKAIQIDYFEDVTCEDLLARVDHFHTQMINNPEAKGLIVLDSPVKGQRDRSPNYRFLIQRNLQRNGFEIERIQFFRRQRNALGGSFWLLPPGAEMPFQDGLPWDAEPLDLTRAFIWDTYEEDGVCPTFAPRAYAELLKTHKNLRGRLVVHSATRRQALATGVEWIKELTERWGVSRKQLRLIIGKRNKMWSSTDFWLVPTTQN